MNPLKGPVTYLFHEKDAVDGTTRTISGSTACHVVTDVGAAEGCLQRTDPAGHAAGSERTHRWLQQTHFAESEILAAKLHSGELLFRQVEGVVEESTRR